MKVGPNFSAIPILYRKVCINRAIHFRGHFYHEIHPNCHYKTKTKMLTNYYIPFKELNLLSISRRK